MYYAICRTSTSTIDSFVACLWYLCSAMLARIKASTTAFALFWSENNAVPVWGVCNACFGQVLSASVLLTYGMYNVNRLFFMYNPPSKTQQAVTLNSAVFAVYHIHNKTPDLQKCTLDLYMITRLDTMWNVEYRRQAYWFQWADRTAGCGTPASQRTKEEVKWEMAEQDGRPVLIPVVTRPLRKGTPITVGRFEDASPLTCNARNAFLQPCTVLFADSLGGGVQEKQCQMEKSNQPAPRISRVQYAYLYSSVCSAATTTSIRKKDVILLCVFI